MSRKSSISQLPLPVRKAVDDALKTGKFTLDGLLKDLRQQFGEAELPSRSALGRYAQRFEEVGKKIRESREVAQVWADRLGKEPSGDIGKLVMELLRTMAFDVTLSMTEGESDVGAGDLGKLALAIHRLETAGRHNLEREKAMRKAALEDAAQTAGAAAKEVGMSEEAIKVIRDRIMLGMAG